MTCRMWGWGEQNWAILSKHIGNFVFVVVWVCIAGVTGRPGMAMPWGLDGGRINLVSRTPELCSWYKPAQLRPSLSPLSIPANRPSRCREGLAACGYCRYY